MKFGKKLTAEQEAKAFDKERFGADAELTTEEKERIKIRTDNIQIGDIKAKQDRLDLIPIR